MTVSSDSPKGWASLVGNDPYISLTQTRGQLDESIEYGLNWNGERLMTLSTSAVVVCCARDSASSLVRAPTSLNNLAFSIAIAAWSANVVASSICLSVKVGQSYAAS